MIFLSFFYGFLTQGFKISCGFGVGDDICSYIDDWNFGIIFTGFILKITFDA